MVQMDSGDDRDDEGKGRVFRGVRKEMRYILRMAELLTYLNFR